LTELAGGEDLIVSWVELGTIGVWRRREIVAASVKTEYYISSYE
jgi:hypothetical protein